MEKRDWTFDEDYLCENIARDNLLMSNKNLTDEKRMVLFERVQLYRFLLSVAHGRYSELFIPVPVSSNVIKDRELVLEKMQLEYKQIDQHLITLILELDSMAPIVSFEDKEYNNRESTNTIIERSLSLYNTYSLKFLKTAKEILQHPASLVHISKKNGRHSQCLRDDLANLPFLFIENINHHPDNFIHELQHGIEFKEGYSTHYFYGELGPILMETLYIDSLCLENKKGACYLYNERILEASNLLNELACYFKVMLELSKDFSVNKYKYVEILNKYNLSNVDLYGIDVRESLCYLLSFLKALDIREKIYDNKKLGMRELMSKISSKGCRINNDAQIIFNTYERYLKDICGKQKRHHLDTK